MATRRKDTRPPITPEGAFPTRSVPAVSDIGENSASGLIETPQKSGKDPLDAHDFADGGGSGGAEGYSRKNTKQ